MFQVYELGLEVVRSLKGVVPVVKKHNAELASQMQRAASSVVLNIGEGNRREGLDRKHFFRIAAGSAAEVLAALETAEAWGWTIEADVVKDHLDHIKAILWKLTR